MREKEDTTNAVVLIPTTGARPLTELIRSVKADAKPNTLSLTIVLALNGILEYDLPSEVKLLKLSSVPIGVAETVNRALRHLNSKNLVWIIADDDEWLFGKFNYDLKKIEVLEEDHILLPCTELIDEFSRSTRPLVPIKDSEFILDYLFANFSFRRNPRYITISGACAKNSTWTKVAFENSPAMEDIIYLHKQQMVGTKLIQATEETVSLNVSISRSANRNAENKSFPLSFAQTYLDTRQSLRYFNNSVFKPFALLGKTKDLTSFVASIASGQSKKLPRIAFVKILSLSLMWTLISVPITMLHLLKRCWRIFSGNRVN